MQSLHVVTLWVLCVMCVRMNDATECSPLIMKLWLDDIIHDEEITMECLRLVLCAVRTSLCEGHTNKHTSP